MGFNYFHGKHYAGASPALLASVSHKEAEFVGVFVGNLLCSSLVIVGIFYFSICNTLVRWSPACPVPAGISTLQSVYILNTLRDLLDWLLDFIG